MQHATLRGIYTAALAPKPKNVATVSPVVDDEEHPLELYDTTGNNVPSSSSSSSPFRVDEEYDIPPLILQTKSSLRPSSSSSSTLRFPFGRGSNQDDLDTSAAAEKYAVLGQKQQWRRNRSQRTNGQATIRHVTEDELGTNCEDREELGERASSYLSEHSERPDIPALASSRVSNRESSRADSSRFSSGRSTDESGSQSERELFVVTRQKKSRFAAKLYMPGQNPLYLGRYRSEDAARAACEEAFTTITTPRK